MNKYIVSLSTIITVIAVAGCTAKSTETPAPTAVLPEVTPTAAAKVPGSMNGIAPMRCEIAKADGTDQITVLTKNGKSKASGKTLAQGKNNGKMMGNMLNDTEYIYFWTDGEKTGTKMSMNVSLPSAAAQASGAPQKIEDYSKEDVRKEYEDKGYKYNCVDAVISDAELLPPKDVTFTDYSKMMQDSMKLMPSGKAGASPNASDMKALQEQMMKQYGNQ